MTVKSVAFDQLRRRPSSLALVADAARRLGAPVPSIDGTQGLMQRLGIDLVIDVGANIGQYGFRVRCSGYRGPIESFEPVSNAYAQLQRNTAQDENWRAHHVAIGAGHSTQEINVSSFSVYSSFLPMTDLIGAAPRSEVVRTEKVPVAPLDSFDLRGSRPLLKIDVQGWEAEVLEGASRTLESVQAVQAEVSFEPHYEGEMLAEEMVQTLASHGFRLIALTPLKHTLLQADAVFIREAGLEQL